MFSVLVETENGAEIGKKAEKLMTEEKENKEMQEDEK